MAGETSQNGIENHRAGKIQRKSKGCKTQHTMENTQNKSGNELKTVQWQSGSSKNIQLATGSTYSS